MLRGYIDSIVLKVLTEEANKIANDARSGAKTERIRNNISVGVAETDGSGHYRIDIVVDTKKAPEAAAYEYGSGLHRKDNPSTYVIKPKEDSGAPFLAFEWPDHDPDYPIGRKYIGYSNRGKFLFNYVDHPGVAAQPYLRPAMERNRPSIKAKFINIFKRGILDSIKAEFKNVD